jgi:large subunit ribosomal protein L30
MQKRLLKTEIKQYRSYGDKMKKKTKIRIRLVKSVIGCKPVQRKTVHALGLKKINSFVEKDINPQVMGMVNAISHLVAVEEIT